MMKQMIAFTISSILTCPPSFAQGNKTVLKLSLEEYTERALQESLRSLSARDSLKSSGWSFKSTKRGLTWPRLTASAQGSKSLSDTDTGTESDTLSRSGTLSLTQPLLTEADISVSSTWTENETETDVSGSVSESFTRNRPSVSASVTQPLPIFVRNSSLRTRKEATLSWENAQDSYRAEMLRIAFDARSIYYNLLLSRESMVVEQKKYESAKLVHKITKALVRVGKKPRVEALRADIRAQADKRRIQNVEIGYDQSLNSAKDFILVPVKQPIRLTSKLTYTPFVFKLPGLIDLALDKNPDINVRRRQVELQRIGLKRTHEGNNPRFDATGSYTKTLNRSDLSAPIDPYSWSVGLNLNWPVFDATQTKLSALQSEVSLRNSERNFEQQERQLKVDIENAFLDVKRTEEQIKTFGKQKKAANRSLKAIRLQYRNGISRLTDVFDAETQLRDLDLEYLQLLVDYNVARDRLSQLVGVDLTTVEEEDLQ